MRPRRTQRPLWASTGVKNPDYSDTLYVSDLVVDNVVNTMPEKTLLAFADHGASDGDQITPYYDDAARVMEELARVGVDYDSVIATLEREGVEKFSTSWDELVDTVRAALDRVGLLQGAHDFVVGRGPTLAPPREVRGLAEREQRAPASIADQLPFACHVDQRDARVALDRHSALVAHVARSRVARPPPS